MTEVQRLPAICPPDDCEGERGERGKRGHRGATGPTGPTGPTELAPVIAAADVNAFNGGILFLAMDGFVNPPVQNAPGDYTLTLSNPPANTFQLVPVVTPRGNLQFTAVAFPTSPSTINVNIYDAAGNPDDDIFYIVVHTVPLFP